MAVSIAIWNFQKYPNEVSTFLGAREDGSDDELYSDNEDNEDNEKILCKKLNKFLESKKYTEKINNPFDVDIFINIDEDIDEDIIPKKIKQKITGKKAKKHKKFQEDNIFDIKL